MRSRFIKFEIPMDVAGEKTLDVFQMIHFMIVPDAACTITFKNYEGETESDPLTISSPVIYKADPKFPFGKIHLSWASSLSSKIVCIFSDSTEIK